MATSCNRVKDWGFKTVSAEAICPYEYLSQAAGDGPNLSLDSAATTRAMRRLVRSEGLAMMPVANSLAAWAWMMAGRLADGMKSTSTRKT